MPIAVIYIVAGILFMGAAQEFLPYLPYGYYTVLRIVATVAFIWAFLVSFNRNAAVLPWIYLLFALVFNPVLKIPLPQELWTIVYMVSGALLLLTTTKIKQQSVAKIV